MGLTPPIPPEPPVAGERSQNGTHGRGFANATPKTGAPLTAPCRSALEYGATVGSDGIRVALEPEFRAAAGWAFLQWNRLRHG
jgi:hypothetical protein